MNPKLKSQHTPGPWIIEDGYIMTADKKVLLVDVRNMRKVDACLIASSPKLLKACKVARQAYSNAEKLLMAAIEEAREK